MQKLKNIQTVLGLATILSLIANRGFTPVEAASTTSATPVEIETRLSAGLTLTEQLRAMAGNKKRVTLLLRSGQSLTGILAEATNAQVLLTELSGKEFFDALVRIEDISALQAQTRKR